MAEWKRLDAARGSAAMSLGGGAAPLAAGDIPDNHVITVRERSVSVDAPTLIQNNVKTDTFTLDLDGEWDGADAIAIFTKGDLAVRFVWYGVPITIPSQLTAEIGSIDVSVVGYGDGGEMRLVTRQANGVLNVVASGAYEGDVPEEDVPDLVSQLLGAADRASWYVSDHTLHLGASAKIDEDTETIVLGGAVS